MAINCLIKSRRYNKNGTYKYQYYILTQIYVDDSNFGTHKKKISKKLYLELQKDFENSDIFENKEDFIIVGNKTCKWCTKAIELLKNKKLSFAYEQKKERELLNKVTNSYKQIPLIFYKNVFIGGYYDLTIFLDNYKNKNLTYLHHKDKYLLDKILKKK